MKKRIITLIVTVGLIISTSYPTFAEEEFTLRCDINFLDSLDTVKSKETFKVDEDESSMDGDYFEVYDAELVMERGQVAGIDDTTVSYYFNDDELVEMDYEFNDCFYDKAKYEKQYDTLKEALTDKYGEPLPKKNFSDMYPYNTVLLYRIADAYSITETMGNIISIDAYDEWIYELDGYGVKIELSQWTNTFPNREKNPTSYRLNVGYKYISEDELNDYHDTINEASAQIDNDL